MKLRDDDGVTKSRELEVFEQMKHMITLHLDADISQLQLILMKHLLVLEI